MCHLGLQHLPCVFHCSNLCFVFSYWSLEANFLVFHSAQLKATKSRRHSSGNNYHTTERTNVPSTSSCLIYVIFCFLPISCPVCRVGVHHFCTKCALFAPGSHHCAQARETCSITQQRGVGKNILGFVEFLPPLPRTPVNYHLKPPYVLRQLWRWLSCILSLPMAATMCIITLCTIPLLCTITLHNCFVHNTFVHKTFVHNTFALHNCFGQKYFGCLVSYPTSGSPPAAT